MTEIIRDSSCPGEEVEGCPLACPDADRTGVASVVSTTSLPTFVVVACFLCGFALQLRPIGSDDSVCCTGVCCFLSGGGETLALGEDVLSCSTFKT